MYVVTTHNHAHQKKFPFIVAHPCSLPLPIPLHNTQEIPLLLLNWYIIKLPMFSALIWHNVKLQDYLDYG
jgi:hypothetical protein